MREVRPTIALINETPNTRIPRIRFPKLRMLVAFLVCVAGIGGIAQPQFASAVTPADPPNLLKDVNANTRGLDFMWDRPVSLGDEYLFATSTPEHGKELWKSDGTESGTTLVKDICEGECSGFDGQLVELDGYAYFRASDGVSGIELWKTDGTEAGTVMVTAFVSEWSEIDWLTGIGSTLYFSANDGTAGRELWASDGTLAGTSLVADICNGGCGSNPHDLTVFGSVLYFFAEDEVTGDELWRSDGTSGGTSIVKNIHPDGYGGMVNPGVLTVLNGGLLFYANDGVNGTELWGSDGTGPGTAMVKNIRPDSGSDLYNFTVAGDLLFFSANDGIHGNELWKSDGTSAGTVLVKDVWEGEQSGSPYELAAFGEFLMFVGSDGVGEDGHAHEVWRSDGTTEGTVMIQDVRVGPESSYPADFTVFGETVLFSADNGTNGRELYASRGDVGDLEMFELNDAFNGKGDGLSDDESMLAVGDTFFFLANDGLHGTELWTSDGTASGTAMVKDIEVRGEGSDTEGAAEAVVGSTMFFNASDGQTGVELWKTDGTTGGTRLVKDINPEGSANLDQIVAMGDKVYFTASTPEFGRELWRSDGTSAGTVLVKDINPGAFGSSIQGLTVVGNVMFFAAIGVEGEGPELWRSDGTSVGTVLVKDINPGPNCSCPGGFFDLNGTVYFSAQDAEHGIELWRSDGTEVGTMMVTDIFDGVDGSEPYQNSWPSEFAELGGRLFFSAEDEDGRELWVTEGTEESTRQVADIAEGSAGSWPRNMTNFDGYLYFSAEVSTDGEGSDAELWRTDGVNVEQVKDICEGTGGSWPYELTVAGDLLFFVADDCEHGFELWVSNGLSAGTVMVKDVYPEGSAEVNHITAVDGFVYFYAEDPDHGAELWVSDGTDAGTTLVGDLATGTDGEGAAGSHPDRLVSFRGTLLFYADSGILGRELWRIGEPSALEEPSNPDTPSVPGGTLPTVLPSLGPIVPPAPLAWGGARTLQQGAVVNSMITVDPALGVVSIVGNDWSLRIGVTTDATGRASVPLQPDGRIVIRRDRFFSVSGDGFLPNSEVRVYLLSTPILIGSVFTDGAGRVAAVLRVPSTLVPGIHTLQVNAYSRSRSVRSVSLGIRYVDVGTTSMRIVFDPASARVAESDVLRLQRLARVVKRSGALQIEISVDGYTRNGSVGVDDAFLSTERARAVAKILRESGLAGDYRVVGKGEARGAGNAARRAVITVSITR